MALILSGTDGLSDVDGSAATPAIRGTDANTGMFFPAADTIAFAEGGVEAMRLDSVGNVGIGTSSPTQKLTVSGSINVSSRGSSFAYITPDWRIYNSTSGNALVWDDYTTERMRLDSSGNLLVGTTSNGTGANISSSRGLGTTNAATGRFATVEYGSGASGTFSTITISFTVNSSNSSVILETLMTGFSQVFMDRVDAQYAGQPAVVMRNNSSGASGSFSVNGAVTTYTLTISTSVTHPVVKVKATVGGLGTTITLPTITFA